MSYHKHDDNKPFSIKEKCGVIVLAIFLALLCVSAIMGIVITLGKL